MVPNETKMVDIEEIEKIEEIEETEECGICYTSIHLKSNAPSFLFPCDHATRFHLKCVLRWIFTNNIHDDDFQIDDFIATIANDGICDMVFIDIHAYVTNVLTQTSYDTLKYKLDNVVMDFDISRISADYSPLCPMCRRLLDTSRLLFCLDALDELLKVKMMMAKPLTIQYLRCPNDTLQMMAISHHTYYIRYIDSPSERIQMEMCSNPKSINYLVNVEYMTENVQRFLLKKSPKYIANIQHPSESVLWEFIEQCPDFLLNLCLHKSVDEMTTFEMKKKILEKDGSLIQYFKHASYELQVIAVREDWQALRSIAISLGSYDALSDEIQFEACRAHPEALRWVQKTDLQLRIIQKNPSYLYDGLSDDIKLAGLALCGDAIRHLETKTRKMIRTAMQQNPHSIRFVSTLSANLKKEAVELDPTVIQYFKRSSQILQLTALNKANTVSQMNEIYALINRPCRRAREIRLGNVPIYLNVLQK